MSHDVTSLGIAPKLRRFRSSWSVWSCLNMFEYWGCIRPALVGDWTSVECRCCIGNGLRSHAGGLYRRFKLQPKIFSATVLTVWFCRISVSINLWNATSGKLFCFFAILVRLFAGVVVPFGMMRCVVFPHVLFFFADVQCSSPQLLFSIKVTIVFLTESYKVL
jgi:hypothetical protein